jgi:hypothetical protein
MFLTSNSNRKVEEKYEPFLKRILIVEDDSDITFTFKSILEKENKNKNNTNKFEVYCSISIITIQGKFL